MALTPEDVSNKRFTPVRLREGYDMGEVDQFLDEVEATLAALYKERDDLKAQLATAQSAPAAQTSPATAEQPAVTEAPAPVPEPVVSVASTGGAETVLRVETVADASSAAARLLELATKSHDETIEKANVEADKIRGEAKATADRLEYESRTKAEKVEQEARSRAALLETETAQKRQEIFGELERERDRLNGEVEQLRAFEREYRSRLKNYFSQKLDELNAAPTESGPDSDTAAAPRRVRSPLLEGGEAVSDSEV